jgi:hypothetical protein
MHKKTSPRLLRKKVGSDSEAHSAPLLLLLLLCSEAEMQAGLHIHRAWLTKVYPAPSRTKYIGRREGAINKGVFEGHENSWLSWVPEWKSRGTTKGATLCVNCNRSGARTPYEQRKSPDLWGCPDSLHLVLNR